VEAVRRKVSPPRYPAAVSGYRPQAHDTTEAIDRLVFEGFARMAPAARLALCARACRDLRELSMAGLRLRYPNASDRELRCRAGALALGRELTLRAFGPEAEAWFS
jgi:hypothetical protein